MSFDGSTLMSSTVKSMSMQLIPITSSFTSTILTICIVLRNHIRSIFFTRTGKMELPATVSMLSHVREELNKIANVPSLMSLIMLFLVRFLV